MCKEAAFKSTAARMRENSAMGKEGLNILKKKKNQPNQQPEEAGWSRGVLAACRAQPSCSLADQSCGLPHAQGEGRPVGIGRNKEHSVVLLGISGHLSHRRSSTLLSKSRPLWHGSQIWHLAQDLAPAELLTKQGDAPPLGTAHSPVLKPP